MHCCILAGAVPVCFHLQRKNSFILILATPPSIYLPLLSTWSQPVLAHSNCLLTVKTSNDEPLKEWIQYLSDEEIYDEPLKTAPDPDCSHFKKGKLECSLM